jgi:hypothetical protein
MAGGITPPPDLKAFQVDMDDALACLPDGTITAHSWIFMPADEAPWRHSGIDLLPGNQVTYFAAGRVYGSRGLDFWVEPKFQIWSKIGDDGDIISATRNSHTITADRPGQLMFGNYFPNDWTDTKGSRLQDDAVYDGVDGETAILAVRWAGSAKDGLVALQSAGDPGGLASSEIERLTQGPTVPQGWHYLWSLGNSEIFRDCEAPGGAPAVCCDVHSDVGILQKDVDVPLTAQSEISWRWIVENLPSSIREDTIPTHDYLSIAVEFDNGWDITYYWSCSLKPGTGYVCPLPNWKDREFHVAIRSGQNGLGVWTDERRNLYDDYQHYMKDLGAPPTKIVRVWFIANSSFQRGVGKCAYSNIRLNNGDNELVVL